MPLLGLLASGLLLAAATPSPAPQPSPAARGGAPVPVILFLIDNSASLPPLDPDEKRVAALEKMFTFLQGQPYRLVLFGGRHEIYVDDPSKYNNRGQWTDFYFAFDKMREVVESYPPGTDFRVVLLTDGLMDPGPNDWGDMNVPAGAELKTYATQRLLELLQKLKLPLYVILVGEVTSEGIATGDKERAPQLILDMVRAADGAKASKLAQSLSSFFKDDGVLLRKFVYRVPPEAGLKRVEPIVRRIVAPSQTGVEYRFLGALVLPLTLFLFVMLGLLVRSFPGPGDLEIVELELGAPVHLAADRLHRVESGGWGTTGLTIVSDARQASATLTYQIPTLDLTGGGIERAGLDALTLKLLPMPLEELREALESYADRGSKDEKIYALNLDYMAKNFEPREAERVLSTGPSERRRVAALDFLRAKAHLLTDDALRRKLTDPRLQIITYGKDGDRKDVETGIKIRIGRYGFIVQEFVPGGRRDAELTLYYDRVPSLLGLKTILPDFFQRAFRFRRSSERIVT